MKVIFTNHAKQRIVERDISFLLVKQTVKNPDSHKSSEYGIVVVRKMFGKKILEVIYKVKGTSYIIITSYYGN